MLTSRPDLQNNSASYHSNPQSCRSYFSVLGEPSILNFNVVRSKYTDVKSLIEDFPAPTHPLTNECKSGNIVPATPNCPLCSSLRPCIARSESKASNAAGGSLNFLKSLAYVCGQLPMMEFRARQSVY
ncbi:hypothetical protein AVEN_26270-1 [Araneus ventricosus]|uniref:Uncharacterized protein n=1 Tax=Araneus ventricosus TaxID=182803 RepID=A0A4Y2ANL7_ARAVE|nr:hypothetical protein AVEN_26270-1 [Araneus ventricosus]